MSTSLSVKARRRAGWLSSTAASVLLAAALVAAPAHAVITPDEVPPDSVIDTNNTSPWIVGLGIRSYNGTSGGICTGLLINPRTVIFAAHCVDSLPEQYYNDGNGVASVGYTTDPTFGINNLRDYLFGTSFGDGRTMDASSTMVTYHPGSRYYSTQGTFLPNDVAMAAFDTPTELLGRYGEDGVGLLFSPLTAPVPVTIGGYGQSGNGLTGERKTDFQRRLGTNMLGFLGTERDINIAIYGETVGDFFSWGGYQFQDLYWLDFDEPVGATCDFDCNYEIFEFDYSYLDYDVIKDEPTANESLTASGDSGGPLLTDAFGRTVSLGVLSQGSRTFFDAPEDSWFGYYYDYFSNIGTYSGYNPLFMFSDYIVANNPYKYVSAKAGDGDWADATHWVQDLDPLYFLLDANNQLVNGVTTTIPETPDSTPNFGEVSANPKPLQPCKHFGVCDYDYYGEYAAGVGSAGSATDGALILSGANQDGLLGVTLDNLNATQAALAPRVQPATASTLPVSVGTTALSGPGSTGFVPNNWVGVNQARYFEVTLSKAGVTTISSGDYDIDRLNVTGSGAGLLINDGASLLTEISSYGDAGWVQVDGYFLPRAYTLSGGGLYGNGTLATLGGTSVIGGVLSPGARNGGIGELTVYGDLAFGYAGVLGIDVRGTTADSLIVNGELTLGGGLAVAVQGTAPTYGQQYLVAQSSSDIEGSFDMISSNLTGALRPKTRVAGDALIVEIEALPYEQVLGFDSPLASLLSDLRANHYQDLKPLFDQLDPLPSSALASAFQAMTPYGQENALSLGAMQLGMLQGFDYGGASAGGTLAMASTRTVSNDPLLAARGLDGSESHPVYVDIGEGLNGFFELRRTSVDMSGAGGGVPGEGEATLLSGGFDYTPTKNLRVGVALHYSDGNSNSAASQSESDLLQITAYGTYTRGGLFATAYAGPGSQKFENDRTSLGGASLYNRVNANLTLAGASVGYDYPVGPGGVVVFAGIDAATMKLDPSTELGGSPYALSYEARTYKTQKSRLGAGYYGEFDVDGSVLKPSLTVAAVHDAEGDPEALRVAFAAAPGISTELTPAGVDKDWTEVDLRLEYVSDQPWRVSAGYRTDLQREDLKTQTFYLIARKAF